MISRTNVLGVGVSSINMAEAVHLLIQARQRDESGYVCVTGVHGVIESQRDESLRQIHNRSLLTVPDGMPTVWMGLEQGHSKMGRVYGPDLMLRVMEATSGGSQAFGVRHLALGKDNETSGVGCGALENHEETQEGAKRAEQASAYLYPSQDECGTLDLGEKGKTFNNQQEMLTIQSEERVPSEMNQKYLTHFLYGATDEMLKKLKGNLESKFPGIQIVGTYAPPFRPLNETEEKELRELVSKRNPDFFWVGLSTPKQERFMAAHADNPDFGIMLGVGAAFPIHAGLQKDAPNWVKNSGLQWFHRLCQEPKRLWRRYLDIVPTFLWFAALQLLGIKKYSIEEVGVGRWA